MRIKITIKMYKLDKLEELFESLSKLEKQYNLKDCTVEVENLMN